MGTKETENGMNIHIANLSPHTSLTDLAGCFAAFGPVTDVTISTYELAGEARCIGLIEMPSDVGALAAIAALKDKKLDGKVLKVREE